MAQEVIGSVVVDSDTGMVVGTVDDEVMTEAVADVAVKTINLRPRPAYKAALELAKSEIDRYNVALDNANIEIAGYQKCIAELTELAAERLSKLDGLERWISDARFVTQIQEVEHPEGADLGKAIQSAFATNQEAAMLDVNYLRRELAYAQGQLKGIAQAMEWFKGVQL